MIRLLFVSDGKRDAVTVPRLVEGILDAEIQEETRDWARLHRAGRGYERKLRYSVRQAIAAGAHGVVATVDRDKDKRQSRIGALDQARTREREAGNALAIAIGQADPHGDVWLLDDAHAVREGLGLPASTDIPNVRRTNSPRTIINDLCVQAEEASNPVDLLSRIARLVTLERCQHAKETGFRKFSSDVIRELGSLVDEHAR